MSSAFKDNICAEFKKENMRNSVLRGDPSDVDWYNEVFREFMVLLWIEGYV